MRPRTTAGGPGAATLRARVLVWPHPGADRAWCTGDASGRGKRSWRSTGKLIVVLATQTDSTWRAHHGVTPDTQLLARLEGRMEQAPGHEFGLPAPAAAHEPGHVAPYAGVPAPLPTSLPWRLAKLARVLLQNQHDSPAVLEPLREHLPKSLGIHVAHDGRRGVSESGATEVCAVRKIDVLAAQERLVEQAELEQQRASNEEIRRDRIRRPAAKRPVLIPERFGESFDGRPGLVREDGAPDKIAPRMATGISHELAQPAWIRNAVGIREGDMREGGRADARIARRCRPLFLLMHDPDVLTIPGQPAQRVIPGTILDDDDLETATRVLLPEKALHSPVDRRFGVVCRNDHADGRGVVT